jgi:Flp pilus assembly pilin Flp
MALMLYVRNWLKAQTGQDLIEYAILVGFIAIVAAVAVSAAGVSVSGLFNWVAEEIPAGE